MIKIIDEKGRLFGLINIFDLFVLCALAFAIFFSLKWLSVAEDPSWVTFETSFVKCKGVLTMPSYMAHLVKEGDEMLDKNGAVVARIAKVLSNEKAHAGTYVTEDGEKLLFDIHNNFVTVLVDVLTYKKRGEIYSCVTNVPLKIGEGFQMHTKNYYQYLSIREVPYAER